MPILVTGATGRVGMLFTPRLIADGDHPVALVRDAERAAPLGRRGAEIVVGDLRDADARRRAVKDVDAVIHIGAAFRGVPDGEAAAVNSAATVELARVALHAGVGRFVFVSTNLVYGPGRGRPAREDDAPQPVRGAYPTSKAAAEEALRELHRSAGLGLRIVRLAFVYGDGDPHLGEALTWARTWPAHKRLHMIHHADVSQALIRALRAGGVDGRTYNAADDAPVTAAELHTLNHQAAPQELAALPLDDPWDGIVDIARIRAELGFRPIYPSVYTAKDAGAL